MISESLAKIYAESDFEGPSFSDAEYLEHSNQLDAATSGVGALLREAMSAPLRSAYAHVEHKLTTDPAFRKRVNELAFALPVYHVPYTEHVPGMPRITEADSTNAREKRQEYMNSIFQEIMSHAGPRYIDEFVSRGLAMKAMERAIASGGMVMSDKNWEL